MAGLFGTLGTANKGLSAQQIGLETTGHNISNANTVGYSRQRVNFHADQAYNKVGVGQIGTGVNVSSVIRVVDDFLIGNLRTETATQSNYAQKAGVLGEIETILNESSTNKGLSGTLATYFDAWNKLSNNPELDNAKTIVLENGNVLADTINHIAKQLDDLKNNTVTSFEQSTLNFNGNLKQLDVINKQIYKIANDGSIPNDLLDQRDMVLKDLSSFSKIDTSFDQYGRVAVKIGNEDVLTAESIKTISVVVGKSATGESLVSVGGDSLQSRLSLGTNYEVGQILISDPKATTPAFTELNVTSGAAKGTQESLTELANRTSEFNNFVSNLASAVNTVHSDNGKSLNFFDLGPAGTTNLGLNLKVNAAIKKDPALINSSANLSDPEIGDGSRAGAIAKLKDVRFKFPTDFGSKYDATTMTIAGEEGGLTFLGTYTDIVTKNGISKQQADNTLTSQNYIISQLELRQDAISGVNINEEVSDVIRYQRAFQANSRVIQVISEMLDTLINRTGV